MAAIHQKLYLGSNYDQINISEFLADIMLIICNSDNRSQDLFEIMPIEESIHFEQAIPLGIIVHELATNTLKYAWKKKENRNKIHIKLAVHERNFTLSYSDNGLGLPDNFQIGDNSSFGIMLIDLLIHNQLNGEMDFFNKNGANFILKFKLL